MAQVKFASGNHAERTIYMGSDRYDAASFTVNTATTNYDVDAQVAAMFTNVKTAYYTEIRTDQTITVRLNSTDNGAITIASTDSPYVIDQVAVSNIYITNASGSTANVKILCV